MTYISSSSILSSVRQSVIQAQAGLAQAQTEVSSGAQDDLGLYLGAKAGTSVSLKNQIDALQGYTASNSVAATRLDATATTLTSMISAAQAMSATLVTASSAGGSTSGLQTNGAAGLQALLSGLNTSVGGQYVFGGINSAAQPLSSYASTSKAKQSVDDAFQQTFGFAQSSSDAATISGTEMKSFLDGNFNNLFDDSGWSSNWSSASNTAISTDLSSSQKETTSISANQSGFRQIAAAYTMLSEFTGSTMSDDAKAAVVAKASSLIAVGTATLTDAQAAVGTTQAAIEATATRTNAQITVLKGSVSDLDSVDTYELSTRVTALQTQLQASYELTSRLQQLSLVNYLNG